MGFTRLRKLLFSGRKFAAAGFDTLRSTLSARRKILPPLPAEAALGSGREHIAERIDASVYLPRDYNPHVKKKSLADSNRHLRDHARYRRDLVANVASSTAIETGQRVEAVAERLTRAIKSVRLTGSRSRK